MKAQSPPRFGGQSVLLAGRLSLASAEIVVSDSGKTLSVKSHRIEGESIVLTLRGGGEVTCDKSLIEKILPDEVPPSGAGAPGPAPAVEDAGSPVPTRSLLDGTPTAS